MIKLLRNSDFDDIVRIFLESFQGDYFYETAYPDKSILKAVIEPGIAIMLENNWAFGYFVDNTLVGFTLNLDYWYTRNNYYPIFDKLFGISERTAMTDELSKIHMYASCENTVYPIAVCVIPEFRRKGIATKLVNYTILDSKFKSYDVIVDISNTTTISMYKRLGFKFDTISTDYIIGYLRRS